MKDQRPIHNVLVVESPNDAAFFQLLLNKLGIAAETDVVIEDLHKFLDESGQERRGKTAIGEKLNNIRRDMDGRYANLEKLGIILDMDDAPIDKNLLLVNEAISSAFGGSARILKEGAMLPVNTILTRVDNTKLFQASCFFTKDSSGQGNLDSLLLEIRSESQSPVPYADCLSLWRDCVNQSESSITITENSYAKIWLSNFLRAKAKGLGKQGKKILNDFEEKQSKIIEKLGSDVFNLEHKSLKELSAFLMLFK